MRRLTVKLLIFIYIFCGRLVLLLIREPVRRRKAQIRLTHIFSRIGLKPLGIDLKVREEGHLNAGGGFLAVCNHMSYLDIVLLASIRPFVFISSVEMQNSPFVGLMAEYGGTYFVERRNASRLREEIRDISELMRRGFAVLLFPEGTSTNGESVLPFRAPFIEAARKAEAPVIPVCIKYTHVDGSLFGDENRDKVCWYGDMDFTPHFEELLRLKSVTAEVGALESADASLMERKDLSGHLHSEISKAYSVKAFS